MSAAMTHPDAELIALCVRFEALEADYRRECALEQPDAWNGPAGYSETMEAIEDTPATTPEGIKAKARAIWAYYQPGPPDTGMAGGAMWGLICEIAGEEA